jgi:hypothetical protein
MIRLFEDIFREMEAFIKKLFRVEDFFSEIETF